MSRDVEIYPYITNNNRENRQFYMYSQFHGIDFIRHYDQTRKQALMRLEKKSFEVYKDSEIDWNLCLLNLKKISNSSESPIVKELFVLIEANNTSDLARCLEKLVHSFEIRKRVYSEYDVNYKPATDQYSNAEPYVALAAALAYWLNKSSNLKYLNALLKLNDTILSFESELTIIEASVFFLVLRQEQCAVCDLASYKEVIL
jgi:hypothetical protein